MKIDRLDLLMDLVPDVSGMSYLSAGKHTSGAGTPSVEAKYHPDLFRLMSRVNVPSMGCAVEPRPICSLCAYTSGTTNGTCSHT